MKKYLLLLLATALIGNVQAQSNTELQEQIDNIYDVIAKDVANRWKFKGDFRFRNEDITQELNSDRNRNRIRVRVGATAIVNDNIKAEVQFATTENGDARSSNQTLGDGNSRKALDLDLAYAEWTVNDYVKVVVGKHKYAWYKSNSYFFDGDVNPEGLSVTYNHPQSGLFGSATLVDLSERSTSTDSGMIGYQVGQRGKINTDTNYVIAVGLFDHKSVEGYSVQQSSSAGGTFGNTTKTVGCLAGATSCYTNDYDVLMANAELNTRLFDMPVVLFADYAKNDKAKLYNKAYAYGVTVGKASLPGSYELGYVNQFVEKDALFAQWIDSDYAAGNTDGKGQAVRGAYQLNKNWRANFTYFMNKTNVDVPVTVSGKTLRERDYKRLQLDLNYTF